MAIKFHYNEVLEGNNRVCSVWHLLVHVPYVPGCEQVAVVLVEFASPYNDRLINAHLYSDPPHVPTHLQRPGGAIRAGAGRRACPVSQRAGAVHREAAGDPLGGGHADAAGCRSRGKFLILLYFASFELVGAVAVKMPLQQCRYYLCLGVDWRLQHRLQHRYTVRPFMRCVPFITLTNRWTTRKTCPPRWSSPWASWSRRSTTQTSTRSTSTQPKCGRSTRCPAR
jgi:hypothetical protein